MRNIAILPGVVAAAAICLPVHALGGPTVAQETTFISAINPDGTQALEAYWAWNDDNPATYGGGYTNGRKWGANAAGTAGGNVQYFFTPSSGWTATEQTALASGLALWSAIANLTFSQTTIASAAQIVFTRGSDGSAATSASLSGVGADAGKTGSPNLLTITKATISIDTSVDGFGPIDGGFTTSGGYPTMTYLHEEGHAIGLGHGGPYNGTVNASTQQFSAYDTRLWTIMSYIEPRTTSAKYFSEYPVTGTNWGTTPDGSRDEPTTWMLLDILAAQQLYGLPTSTPLSGGQVFGFNSNITGAIAPYFDFTRNVDPIVTLWDAGIGNTLDLSGFSSASKINLNPGTFSSADGRTNNIAIAFDTRIDTAVGGSFADIFTGNNNGDFFRGNGGNDTITGGTGSDTAIFAANRSDYSIVFDNGVYRVQDLRAGSPDGVDTLSAIEFAQFADGTIALTSGDPQSFAWDCSVNPDSAPHSGSVSATKTGSCTQLVLANNTYTGGTTIAAGTLQLGNGGTAGSITGDVANNGTLAFNRSNTVVFSGAVSGSGSLQQTGAGTTFLTGANTYTGGTTISNGGLVVGSGGTTGSITGNVVDNAVLYMARSDQYSFAGAISGTGRLAQIGTGTTILTGNNTYTGGTAVAAGALQLGNGGTTGSITGDVTDNGVLAFNRSDAVVFGGAISGSGALQQIGAGTTFLTGANTYTGGTTIANGGLAVGNGGTTGSIAGNVVDNAVLYIARSNQYSFTGTISGSGRLAQIGTGTTILTGNNTYTGGTAITAGILQLGNGGTTGSITGDVTDNGVLAFNRSDTVVFGGAISGSGSLRQIGTGTTFLTGANTYAGGTTIANGGLAVGAGGTSGSITGNVVNNAVLYMARSDQYTFAGTISGTGRLAQIWTGTTILTGASTYTGGTAITGGTLQIGNGGTTGSITGDVINNSVLAFNRQDSLIFGGTISGSGSLRQVGGSFLYLTADNTYTGGTTIASGALVLGIGGSTGSIVGDVLNDGALYVARASQLTLGGSITGAGSLRLIGSGTTVLTGNNSYTGGTLIAAGMLQLGNGGTTGSIAGDITDNSVLAFNRSNTVVFGGAISGSGSLTQIGAGTTFLTGANIYTGGTTIANGALVIGAGKTSGSITGNIANNALLYFARSDQYTFGGIISGSGTVKQIGSGTTTLTGNNTYTGGTLIAAGTLEVANSNAVGGGDITLGGQSPALLLDNGVNLNNTININTSSFINVNGPNSATLSGALAGSSPFEKDGTGTLILNHDNRPTYSGNISYHGTLTAAVTGAFGTGTVTNLGSNMVLYDGVTVSNAANLVDDLTVTQDGGAASYAGDMWETNGSWRLIKEGRGVLVLAGAGTYTGATIVSRGTLLLTGTLSGGVDVYSGATLGVSGTVNGALTVQSGGTISSVGSGPGTSTLTAAAYTNDGGTLAIRFAGGSQNYASDRVAVIGAVALRGGHVDVHPLTPASDFTFNQRYQIVGTDSAVAGTFANPASFVSNAYDSSLLERLRYDLGGVVLEIRKLIDFATSDNATTPNQLAVARAINASEPGADDMWANVVNALAALSPEGRQQTFDQLSGQNTLSTLTASRDSIGAFSDLMQAHLLSFSRSGGALPLQTAAGGGRTMWKADLDGALPIGMGPTSFTALLNGTTMGFDVPVGDRLMLGFAAAASHPVISDPNFLGQMAGDATTFGVYGRYGVHGAELAITAAHTETALNENRLIRLGSAAASVDGHVNQRATQIDLSLALPQKIDDGIFEYFAAFRYLTFEQDAFSERSAILGLGLDVDARRDDQVTATFGARWRRDFTAGTLHIVPQIGGFVSMTNGDLAPGANVRLRGAPEGTGGFRITSNAQAPLSGTASLGLEVESDEIPVNLALAYASSFSSGSFRQSAQISINIDLH